MTARRAFSLPQPISVDKIAMATTVLIIGEHTDQIDFDASDLPKTVPARSIRAGLEAARDRLNAVGHEAHILWTTDIGSIERETRAALAERHYGVVVIGAGLRVLPAFAAHFERLMNVLHSEAPGARLAFNSQPDDSDRAALRWIEPV